ncbi:hypothetical protein [Naasia sp. SYSU D00057]|uniref:hypothetical protein n=1 Tax=Naasia sp. SYSU D00057 TaxID=2817380 RepID=UPI001B302185|nr:hypothetical protein [Naasia sp. SYSU D00057]
MATLLIGCDVEHVVPDGRSSVRGDPDLVRVDGILGHARALGMEIATDETVHPRLADARP